MRVLAIANAFPKFKEEYEGSYILKQLEALSKQGVEIRVISPTIWIPSALGKTKGKMGAYARIPYEANIGELSVQYPRMPLYNQMYAQWIKSPQLYYELYKTAVYGKVKEIIQEFRPDAIYLTGIFMEGLLGIEIKKDFNISAIFIENSIPRLKDAMNSKKMKKCYRSIVEELDTYIYVSKKQEELLRENGIDCGKAKYLPNGYDIGQIAITKNKKSRDFKVVTVGFMDERKGYPMVLDAISEMKNKGMKIQYTAIGGGYKLDDYRAKAKQLGIESICNFIGRISHKEVIEHVLNSDLFVLPSYDESFGIAYLEAMACHVPVIMTAGEGISDLMENEKNCLMIERGNQQQLVQYMERAYIDSDWIGNIAESGFIRSRDFSYRENAKKLIHILESIV